jgi:DNA-binding winged helix-turn-helix (wHTH) protein/TolB-like protein/tetratricopeptide (TPR) repeat protein
VLKPPGRAFYEFGEFRLDAEKHRLLRGDEIVALTPRAVETLRVLIERPGVLVERAALLNAVWHDVAVEDGNLSVTIFMIRKALGEDTNGRKFIETVPRLGYKFVAEVRVVVESVPSRVVAAQSVDADSPLVPASRNRLTAGIAAAAAVIVAVVAIAYARSWKAPARAGNGDVKSIAVLPFKALGDTSDDTALSLGFADALMTSLGGVRDVRVFSTPAMNRDSNVRQTPSDIGKDLGVDAVLDGTLQRANGLLRVTLRLIRTSDGSQIWSHSFDEAGNEVFKLQDAMASQTAESLKWNLTAEERRRMGKRYTDNREAYQAYLLGRLFFDRRQPEGYEKAIVEFERAIALDPKYALAFTGMADVYALQANIRTGEERDALYEKSRTTATKALELDEGLAEAHTSLGWVKRVHDWDWAGSETEFKRALALNPNNVNAHQWYALLLTTIGRTDEALREIERARELEPLSGVVLLNYFSVRQYRRESAQLPALAEQIARLVNSQAVSTRVRAIAYGRAGNHAKVIEIGDAHRSRNEGKIIADSLATQLALAYSRTRQESKVREMLDYLRGRARTESRAGYLLATVYAELGRKDEAIALLQQCLAAHDDRMVSIKVEPYFDSLRDDARFQALLSRMNL